MQGEERTGVRKAFTAFPGFVILYAALGIPAYLYFRKQRGDEAAAERARVEARERERRNEPEGLLRRPSVPPEIRGPQARPRDPSSRDVYDYLPAEQRKMLRSR